MKGRVGIPHLLVWRRLARILVPAGARLHGVWPGSPIEMIDAVGATIARSDGGDCSAAVLYSACVATAEGVAEAIGLMTVLGARAGDAGSGGVEDGRIVTGDGIMKL